MHEPTGTSQNFYDFFFYMIVYIKYNYLDLQEILTCALANTLKVVEYSAYIC